MIMENFKPGDIVHNGTVITIINEIQDDVAYFSKRYYAKIGKLTPVQIRGGFDNNILLEYKEPVRASIVSSNKHVPIRRPAPYFDCDIDGEPVSSIIEKNKFQYIHQLQNWISLNAPDYYLRPRICFPVL